jgi:hypothetical protein
MAITYLMMHMDELFKQRCLGCGSTNSPWTCPLVEETFIATILNDHGMHDYHEIYLWFDFNGVDSGGECHGGCDLRNRRFPWIMFSSRLLSNGRRVLDATKCSLYRLLYLNGLRSSRPSRTRDTCESGVWGHAVAILTSGGRNTVGFLILVVLLERFSIFTVKI